MATAKATAKRRTGLGANPLDVLLPEEEGTSTAPEASRSAQPASKRGAPRARPNGGHEEAPSQPRKIRATYHLPEDLVEGLRNAALHLAGPPEYLTLSALVENALRKELERMHEKHHKGKPFPQRPHNLRGGRPIGS